MLTQTSGQRHILRERRHSTAACLVCRNWNSKKYFVLSRLEQQRQNKNILHRHDRPNKPTKKEPISFVLFESQFTSVKFQQSPGATSLYSLCLPTPPPPFFLPFRLSSSTMFYVSVLSISMRRICSTSAATYGPMRNKRREQRDKPGPSTL